MLTVLVVFLGELEIILNKAVVEEWSYYPEIFM
jgi:hypothetical protein